MHPARNVTSLCVEIAVGITAGLSIEPLVNGLACELMQRGVWDAVVGLVAEMWLSTLV